MTKRSTKLFLSAFLINLGGLYASSEEAPISLRPLDASPEEGGEVTPVLPVQNLEAPTGEDLNFLGTQKSTDSSLWIETPRKILDHFLPHLSFPSKLPALNVLLEDLIRRGGFPKEGGSAPGSLSLNRAEILMNLGHGDEAAQVLDEDLLSGIFKSGSKGAYEQLKFLSLLSLDDKEKACTFAISKSQGASESFWIKAGIVCNVLQGEMEKAKVRLEALRESSSESALEEALSSGEVEKLPPLDVIIVALLGEQPLQDSENLPPWLKAWGPKTDPLPQDEVLAELKAEKGETQNPRTELQDYIQKAKFSRDVQKMYFLQRLSKLYDFDSAHLGVEIPTPSWRQGLGVSKEDLELLISAAKSKRKGEVILLAATLLKDLKAIHPEVKIKVLLALKSVGYERESEALALELLKQELEK
ncbi:hypothetical protein Bealeia1_00825 [Candidatus Bealeia paramacronuclearis]|uniref:HEAT repeat domain-containing protein n=1 Tax=Candidatus Bealeia paramacronuclearis TaxID=1921001 RepID=A0ABZ2C5D2_9PROT|nr:hypothetical protein [Candidatus Bealeia paramacronuclearis]